MVEAGSVVEADAVVGGGTVVEVEAVVAAGSVVGTGEPVVEVGAAGWVDADMLDSLE